MLLKLEIYRLKKDFNVGKDEPTKLIPTFLLEKRLQQCLGNAVLYYKKFHFQGAYKLKFRRYILRQLNQQLQKRDIKER